ncbi:MAG: hypothetical protein AB4040_19065 [Synechococcus sp.]
MKAQKLRRIVDTVTATQTFSLELENTLKGLMAGQRFNDLEVSILNKLLVMLESGSIAIESQLMVPAAA